MFYITVYASFENSNLCHITCACCIREFLKTHSMILYYFIFLNIKNKIKNQWLSIG